MTRFAQRFVLERKIGAGGMAWVFLGRDEVLDRPVAVKILNPGHGSTDIGDRFRREGRTAARLSHPNIVQVYDAGEGEFEGREVSFIVMEYVSGGDLKGLIDVKGPLPSEEVAKIGADAASGLAHAHEKGIIHRDIKPHNILLDDQDNPKLTDFGIARALDATHATRTGSYLGTALYSSPEQLRGQRVTPKSDVYSLGITLYQAAVGKAPFGGTPIEVASQHVSRTPTVPSTLGAALSGGVESVILDCIRKDPARRPTAEEVRERLGQRAGLPRNARANAASPAAGPRPVQHTYMVPPEAPPSVEPRSDAARREGRRRLWHIIAVAALLLVLLSVGGVFALSGREGLQTAQTSQEESPTDNEENQSAQSAGGEGSSSEQTTPEQQASADDQSSSEQTTPEQQASADDQSNSEAEAASSAVQNLYDAATKRDYDTFSSLLTTNYRNSTWSRAAFDGTFATLEDIQFTSGPTAQVSGNTATASFSTNAYHTNRTEQRTGTATLVRENGEWKIDNLNVS